MSKTLKRVNLKTHDEVFQAEHLRFIVACLGLALVFRQAIDFLVETPLAEGRQWPVLSASEFIAKATLATLIVGSHRWGWLALGVVCGFEWQIIHNLRGGFVLPGTLDDIFNTRWHHWLPWAPYGLTLGTLLGGILLWKRPVRLVWSRPFQWGLTALLLVFTVIGFLEWRAGVVPISNFPYTRHYAVGLMFLLSLIAQWIPQHWFDRS